MSILYIIVIKRARGNFIVFIIRLQGGESRFVDILQHGNMVDAGDN